jgi:hypothetical protein
VAGRPGLETTGARNDRGAGRTVAAACCSWLAV